MNQIIKDIGKSVLVSLIILALSYIHISNADSYRAPFSWESVHDWTPYNITHMQNDMCKKYGWQDKDLIHRLGKIESINLKVPYLIDTNNKPSRGLYHFQEGTFKQYCVNDFKLKNDIDDPVIQTICVIKMGQQDLIHKKWALSYKKIMRERNKQH